MGLELLSAHGDLVDRLESAIVEARLVSDVIGFPVMLLYALWCSGTWNILTMADCFVGQRSPQGKESGITASDRGESTRR